MELHFSFALMTSFNKTKTFPTQTMLPQGFPFSQINLVQLIIFTPKTINMTLVFYKSWNISTMFVQDSLYGYLAIEFPRLSCTSAQTSHRQQKAVLLREKIHIHYSYSLGCVIHKTRGPRGPWVAHLRKRSKVTVLPIIENPRGII